ncbi:MAG: UDP-2,3-diacylglucosamine diphosphatase [Gammaproteobacteria bacterium]|nr:UDP-2,3-diacylglucosamine diphosphatase [Gammaproteobacteria bacterium]
MNHLFVSDLHLEAAAPKAIEAFIGLLRGEARAAASLHILGDLFESWVGDDDPDPARDLVCREIAALAASGVPVFVMPGNRDFLYGAGFSSRTGATVLPDPCVATLCGRRVLLTHGDLLCTGDAAYQELRSTVRAPAFRERVLALPLEARQTLADAARAGSKAHVAAQRAEIMDVTPDAVVAAFRATGTDLMVHGHTHRPAEHLHLVDGKPALRVVLDAWYERGSALSFDGSGFARVPLPFA